MMKFLMCLFVFSGEVSDVFVCVQLQCVYSLTRVDLNSHKRSEG